MFDALLKSKFYCKCKSEMKMTRTRIEMIRRKRNAMQKYLRNDIADLLKNGLDMNAYGRVEGLLIEMNRSNCYEFVDQWCEYISKCVSSMDKQSNECPEECREAVSSLMFAAAGFADLPELRELRTLFSERYGNSLDRFINKEFAEKMKSGQPSKDLKLQLLLEIAAEVGLDWDSKALENKLFNGSAYNENLGKETNDNDRSLRNNIVGPDRKKDYKPAASELKHVREFDPGTKNDPSRYEHKEASRNEIRLLPKKKESPEPPRDNNISPLFPKRHERPLVKDIQVDKIVKTEKPYERASSRNAREDENKDKPLKHRSVPPPPYTKSEVHKENLDQEDSVLKTKPIPKSVRRRKETAGDQEIDEKDKIQQINKEKAVEGQRILRFFDEGRRDERERDDEEKVMDKLLQHYSRKNGSLKEKGKAINNKSRDRPNRITSLPVDLKGPHVETTKGHNRSSSLGTEFLPGNAHVHPKLPDYDDFVARLAVLRGNKAD